jgi:hypothetical protein
MYGKVWDSMYTGSMLGAGLGPFALMPYVISNMKPQKVGDMVEMRLELNPKLLAVILGTTETVVEKAIEWACSPDPDSRSKDEDGRRLVRLGQFEYLVVNGWAYTQKKAIERRREQLRRAAQKYRGKKIVKESSNPHGTNLTKNEQLQNEAHQNGDVATEQRAHELRDNVPHGTYDNIYQR